MMAPAALADTDETEQIASQVEAASPENTIVTPVVDGSVTAGEATVSVPSDPAGQIKVTGKKNGQVLPTVSVTLPQELQAAKAKVSKDGTVVYSAKTGQHVDAAVQVLPDGSIRVMTILKNKQAPTSFTYTFPGLTPVINDDGSVDLTQTATDTATGLTVSLTVGRIDPAWATDANGVSVTTRYAVNPQAQLIQTVAPTKDTKYPVVVDPKVSVSLSGVTIWFNRTETNRLAWGGAWATAVLAAVAGPAAIFVAVYYGAWVAWAGYAYSVGKCLTATFGLLGWLPGRYSGGYCA